jgi:hypothetical protein
MEVATPLSANTRINVDIATIHSCDSHLEQFILHQFDISTQNIIKHILTASKLSQSNTKHIRIFLFNDYLESLNYSIVNLNFPTHNCKDGKCLEIPVFNLPEFSILDKYFLNKNLLIDLIYQNGNEKPNLYILPPCLQKMFKILLFINNFLNKTHYHIRIMMMLNKPQMGNNYLKHNVLKECGSVM